MERWVGGDPRKERRVGGDPRTERWARELRSWGYVHRVTLEADLMD